MPKGDGTGPGGFGGGPGMGGGGRGGGRGRGRGGGPFAAGAGRRMCLPGLRVCRAAYGGPAVQSEGVPEVRNGHDETVSSVDKTA